MFRIFVQHTINRQQSIKVNGCLGRLEACLDYQAKEEKDYRDDDDDVAFYSK